MSKYDTNTTTFSPDGNLYQVVYAIEATNNAGISVGIVCNGGIVLAAEKKLVSKLLDVDHPKGAALGTSAEKIFTLDDHCVCAVAGLNSDALFLVDRARIWAQQHKISMGEPVPVDSLVRNICDTKQQYTHFGGLRPFGVSFLYAGWDQHSGFQLFMSDPSGTFTAWKAQAIGNNFRQANDLLNQEFKDDLSLQQGCTLALKILSKTMDTLTLTTENLEFATFTVSPCGRASLQLMQEGELGNFVTKYKEEREAEEAEKKKKEEERERKMKADA